MAATTCNDARHDRDLARTVLLVVGLVGELLFGGLIFGWNSLSVVLKDLGNYDDGCDGFVPTERTRSCPSQSAKLAVVWNAGVFAVNFGPALVGLCLDFLGPKATATLGSGMCSLGLVILAVSHSDGVAALPAGSFFLALGGLAFHLAQFNVSQLFPQHRGLVTSSYVGGFIASGIVFQALRSAFDAAGGSRAAYRAVFLAHAALVALYVPIMAWMLPRRAVKPGERYAFDSSRFTFQLVTPAQRTAPDATPVSCEKMPAHSERACDSLSAGLGAADHGGHDPAALADRGCVAGCLAAESSDSAPSVADHCAQASPLSSPPARHSAEGRPRSTDSPTRPQLPGRPDSASASAVPCTVRAAARAASDSQSSPAARCTARVDARGVSDSFAGGGSAQTAEAADTPAALAARGGEEWCGTTVGSWEAAQRAGGPHTGVDEACAVGPLGESAAGAGSSGSESTKLEAKDDMCSASLQLDGLAPPDGCSSLMRDEGQATACARARRRGRCLDWKRPVYSRWVALSRKSVKQQLQTPDLYCLGTFFVFNVLSLQFYLGTARLQLEEKGDDDDTYTAILGYVVAGIALVTPLNGFFLDRLGYGITLLIINTAGLVTLFLQMIPNLEIQVLTMISWAFTRYLLYSSFFTICGVVFSHRSFGRVTGAISVITGLVGLLQIPFTDLVLGPLDDRFLPMQIASAVWVSLLYVPALLMYRWERSGRPAPS